MTVDGVCTVTGYLRHNEQLSVQSSLFLIVSFNESRIDHEIMILCLTETWKLLVPSSDTPTTLPLLENVTTRSAISPFESDRWVSITNAEINSGVIEIFFSIT